MELGKLGIETAEKLESLITKRLSEALEDERKTLEDRQRDGRDNDRSRSGVFFTHLSVMNIMIVKEFGVGFYGLIFDIVESELSQIDSKCLNENGTTIDRSYPFRF